MTGLEIGLLIGVICWLENRGSKKDAEPKKTRPKKLQRYLTWDPNQNQWVERWIDARRRLAWDTEKGSWIEMSKEDYEGKK